MARRCQKCGRHYYVLNHCEYCVGIENATADLRLSVAQKEATVARLRRERAEQRAGIVASAKLCADACEITGDHVGAKALRIFANAIERGEEGEDKPTPHWADFLYATDWQRVRTTTEDGQLCVWWERGEMQMTDEQARKLDERGEHESEADGD